jgi:hypothetical protein
MRDGDGDEEWRSMKGRAACQAGGQRDEVEREVSYKAE